MITRLMKNYEAMVLVVFLAALNATLAQVAPGNPLAIPVEYRFNHALTPPDSGVGLNGSYNNWLGGVYKMKEYQPGWWKIALELLPLTYEYKFVTYTDTVGQSGVTAYFSDPLNPVFGGPFNNSYSIVRSPMIYYLLPKSGSFLMNDHPTITANISYANNTQLNLARMSVTIDGNPVANPWTYYDTTARFFSYTPPLGLTLASHTVRMAVYTVTGDSAVGTTTFTVSSIFSIAPYTFQFDSKSPSFEFQNAINRVDIKGDFNSGGSNIMTDPDSDGVYTYTTNLNVNKPNEYTIIVNTGLYINDPDNPMLSANHRTYVVKNLTRIPEFRNFSPASCRVYQYPVDSVVITCNAYKSDSSIAFNLDSLKAVYDGTPLLLRLENTAGNYKITVSIPNPTLGKHTVRFSAVDNRQNAAAPVNYGFAVLNQTNTFFALDNDDDDNGAGTYQYPAGIQQGCADIRDMTITATPNLDSLEFAISMKTITDNTRLALMIANKYDGSFAPALQDVELNLPEWNNRGVYLILAKPSALFYDPAKENRLYISRDPLQTGSAVVLDNAALSLGIFKFKLPLAALEEVMGTYKDKWLFSLFSYLRDQNGTVEITSALGGSSDTEDPDVYDALFFSNPKIQERMLLNWNSPAQIGGVRIARIGSDQRGAMYITPEMIHTQLGQLPNVQIYANGGDLLSSTVTITGIADMSPGTTVNVKVNGAVIPMVTNANKLFSGAVQLTEGVNKITAEAVYNSRIIRSKAVYYNYVVDHQPVAKITGSVNANQVTLDGSASYDPDGGALTYKWMQDEANPQQITLGSTTSANINFTAPAKKGEYFFTLTTTDNSSLKGWARAVVTISDSGTILPNLPTYHSAWIDTANIYCIFVRTFDAAGTFNSVTARMSELRDLGIDCIWFLPIHPTTGDLGPDNPGYATTNYLDALPNYGTKEDFKLLVAKAHEYGIRVILDHVIQHTSDQHPFMKDANRFKQYSPYYPFYYWDANNNFQYLFTWVQLPSLNYDNEITRNYLLRVAKYWTQEFSIDGFRSDVAWAINDLRAQGPAYWQKWRQELKSMKPDVFLLAEADAAAPRFFDAKFDAAYDYNWFNTVRSLIGGTASLATLDSVINAYYAPAYPKHAMQFRYLENQDEQRFIEAYGVANAKIAAAFLFSCPGVPLIYAGQEVGEMSHRGNIHWNDPQLLRPYFKKLISIRNFSPALRAGNFKRIANDKPTAIYSFLRVKDTSNVICNYNFGGDSVSFTINVPIERLAFDSLAVIYLNDLLNNKAYQVVCKDLRNFQMTLAGKSAHIMILSKNNLVSAEEPPAELPLAFSLAQNYPNPFNPSTTIRYELPSASAVKLSVYNILGQRVAELVNTIEPGGMRAAVFNGDRMASGIYFARLEAKPLNGGKVFTSVRKMALVK